MKGKKINVIGSITVFAAMVMLFLIAALLTIVQVTAVRSGQYISDQAHMEAVRAFMGGYRREIFDNYHIFVVDGGFGTGTLKKSDIENELDNYIRASCNPAILYMDKSYSYVNLTGAEFDKVKSVNYKFITDRNGEYFIDQVVKYMKYQVGEDFLESYKNKISGFEEIDKAKQEIKKELEDVSSASDISDDLLKLMSYVDGIKIDSGQISYDRNGKLEFEENFAKLIVASRESMEDMGLNNEKLYNKLDNKVVVLPYELKRLQSYAEIYLSAVEENDKDEKKKRKGQCKDQTEYIVGSIESAIEYCKKSQDLIDDILDKLSDGNSDAVKDTVNELELMEKALARNEDALNKILDKCKLVFSDDKEDINNSLCIISELIEMADEYVVSDIKFDYSGLAVQKQSGNYLSVIMKLISDGALELVTEKDKLSTAAISDINLPSEMFGNSSGKGIEEGILASTSSKIKAAINGIKEVAEIMTDGSGSIGELLARTSEKILRKALFNEYIIENFISYSSLKEDINCDISHKITYEVEYVLFGNKTDKANIKAVINRLMIVRTLCNFLTIATDKEKVAQARAAAVAAFGFTGVPVITEAVKFIIEILWSYEEALVDVSALMKGYKVPVIKNGKALAVGIDELVKISKSYIQSNAEKYKTENGDKGVSYKEYLELFLLLTNDSVKAYRCMDLIQINFNGTYGTNLRMNNCICGLSSKMDIEITMKYINMKFVNNLLGKSADKLSYNSEVTYMY